MKRGTLRARLWGALFVVSISGTLGLGLAQAQSSPATGNFSLQVTPSPLVTTVQPGQTTDLELKVRNAGTSQENLKIEPRSFKLSSTGSQVTLDDTTPPDVASWISFSAPKFSVAPGEWYTQHIKLSLPKESGFSYSFVLVISRQTEPKATDAAGRLIKGSVAVFTLVNVDRPGATRKLEVAHFTPTKKLYEYVPTTFEVTFKNTGNTIVQPYGNIFVQRSSGSTTPLATLAVNETKSYILPDSSRTVTANWSDGFFVRKVTSNPDGSQSSHLTWNWSKLSDFRIGRYTAKLVAVYNDGQRDVPIEGEVSFWVVPWKLILVIIVIIVGLWFLQHWRHKRKTEKAVKRALEAAQKSQAKKEETSL